MPTCKSIRLWVYVVTFPVTVLQGTDIILWQSSWKGDKKLCSSGRNELKEAPWENKRKLLISFPSSLLLPNTNWKKRGGRVILYSQRVSEGNNKKTVRDGRGKSSDICHQRFPSVDWRCE